MGTQIKCPNCGSTHYVEHYSTSTAMGWIQEYNDGKLVGRDPNISTTYCSCCSCRHNFQYKTQYGEIYDIIDTGLPNNSYIEPANIKLNVTNLNDYLYIPTTMDNDTIIVNNNNNNDNNNNNNEIDKIKLDIEALQGEVRYIKDLIEDLRKEIEY